MATLSLQHIDKIYDNNVQAVFDFNLDVKDGELIVLVGPESPLRCAWSQALRTFPTANSCWTAKTSQQHRPRTETWQWYSRATPCTAT